VTLYLDYRPDSWENFYGNETTLSALTAMFKKPLKRESIPHAFMFYGPTGCGKTTLARIIAFKLGCDPLDFMEINASNNRGIDTAREIIQIAGTMPMNGLSRVFLLDEVHMATKEFQNALLKPLEDTPPHAYFILCTTAPEGIIVAIKNRCHHFKVEPLSQGQLGALITGVAEAEGQELEEDVTFQIISASEGSPRQALIILEKVLSLPESERLVAAEFESPENAQTIELCRALIKRAQWKEIAKLLKGIQDEPEKVRRAVLGYFNTVLLGSWGAQADYAALVIELFAKGTFMYSGKAGLTHACYMAATVGG
jgi:DNA polymerase III gamma/tau subunit